MIPLRDDEPSRMKPVVTVTLIAVNVLFFLYELSLGPERLQEFLMGSAFVPARLFGSPAGNGDLQLGGALLSMFLHGGVVHLGGNMLFLWIFGDNVEDRLGHLRFVLFYLGCGFIATYAQAGTFVTTRSVLALTLAEAVWAAAVLVLARLLLRPAAATLARREEAIHLALLER
jgi:membrane associated rhomboid family serine protease